MSPRPAYHELHWMHAPEYLFGLQISDDGQFFYESINPAFERSLGISIEGSRKKTIHDCMSEDDARSIRTACDACIAEGRPVRHRQRLALGGRRREFDTTISPVRDPGGNIVQLVGSHRLVEHQATIAVDRIVRRQAAAELDRRLLSLQEEVQQRIASDLHDSTCQHLIAASLNIMRLRCAMEDDGTSEKLFDAIDGSIDRAQKEIRAFTYLLHPQNLLTDRLKATIEKFVDGYAARTSLKTRVRIADEVDELSYEKQRSLLRVIQEALANIFRHARATEVTLAIEATATHFKLRIRDNGRGMPNNQPRSGPKAISFGVGIPAMRARLLQMGGVLEIHSSPKAGRRGTTLCATIPYTLRPRRSRPREQDQGDLGYQKSVAQ